MTRPRALWLLLPLLCLQGCFSAANLVIHEFHEPSLSTATTERVPVTRVRAQRTAAGLEVTVRYADGVHRVAEWDLKSVPNWLEDGSGTVSDLEAEDVFSRQDRYEEAGRYTELVTALDGLLLGGDRVVETPRGTRLVRDVARERLLALEGRGRDAYLLLHEDAAARALAAAQSVEDLEQVIALHPAAPAALEARGRLVERLVEEGRFVDAGPYLDVLLGAPSLEPERRARWERLRDQFAPRWVRAGEERIHAAAPGWPAPTADGLCIVERTSDGLMLRNEQLHVVKGGELVALLDLRRQVTNEDADPGSLTESLTHGVRTAVTVVFVTVGIALDVATFPAQLTVGLVVLATLAAIIDDDDED